MYNEIQVLANQLCRQFFANQHLKPFHEVVKFFSMGALFFKFRSRGDFNKLLKSQRERNLKKKMNDKRCTFNYPAISLSFVIIVCINYILYILLPLGDEVY